MSEDQCCYNCAFYKSIMTDESDGIEAGYCRRFPPMRSDIYGLLRAIYDVYESDRLKSFRNLNGIAEWMEREYMDRHNVAQHPIVYDFMWCGEWDGVGLA